MVEPKAPAPLPPPRAFLICHLAPRRGSLKVRREIRTAMRLLVPTLLSVLALTSHAAQLAPDPAGAAASLDVTVAAQKWLTPEGFTFAVTTAKRVYVAGSDISLAVKLINTTDTERLVRYVTGQRDLDVEIRRDGIPVEFDAAVLRERRPYEEKIYGVRPGSRFETALFLSEAADVAVPGQYVVKVRRRFGPPEAPLADDAKPGIDYLETSAAFKVVPDVEAPGDPSKDFTLTVRPAEEPKPDPGLRTTWGHLRLTVKNQGDHAWFYGADAYDRGMHIILEVDGGRLLMSNRAGQALAETYHRYNHRRRHVDLLAGEEATTDLYLSHYFDLAPATTYRVKLMWESYAYPSRASRQHDAFGTGVARFRIESAPITFTTP